MENVNGQPYNKFELPLKWGLIIGVVSILLFTVYGMFLMTSMGMTGSIVLGVVTFLVTMILLGVMAAERRKELGGFITIKEAFQPIFIAILIIVTISTLYSIVYTKWIDPGYMERTKEMATNFTVKLGGSDEAADMAAAKMDEQMEKQNSVGGKLMSYAISIVFYSIFGFIIAAIIKRKKPEHLAE